jgi:hypothetical protein
VTLRGSWKFFPKTAVYIEGSDTINLYWNPGQFMHPNSYPLHTIAGITGLITTKLSLNAWIGYANGFYVSGPNPNTAIGGLDLRWKPTMLSTGLIGYKHDFLNSLLGSYYDLDTVYIGWAQLIWRFTGTVRAAYSNQRFQGILPVTGLCAPGAMTCPRTDNLFQLNARVDYPFKDWLMASIGYDLSLDRSDAALMISTAGAPGLIPVNYTKHEAWGRLTLAY